MKIDNKIYDTWLTRTTDFKREGEHKLTFETYYEINRLSGEEVWPFIVRSKLEQYFYEVFLLDYLKDGPVNNFVGSMSLSENLKLVPKQMLIVARTKELGENILFKGMEMLRESCEGAVPNTYWNCVRKMIIERRDNIEKIFAER